MKLFSMYKVLGVLVAGVIAISAFAADTISGKVRNMTTGQPGVGDQVILLRLGEGMEASASARTDATGAFTLPVVVAGAPYIVRVMHQGVNYDQLVRSGAPVDIQVFDAAAKVSAISGSLGITQLESDGTNLKVAEMYAINNLSSPPRAQAGAHNFDFVLPAHAQLDLFQAKTAGGVWVNVQPKPSGQQRYAVDFPLRPGETLFRYTYHLPYGGPATLRLKAAYPTRNYAIMHPPSMTFRPLRAGAFATPGQVQGLVLEQAAGQSVVRDVPAFEISGTGSASPTPSAKARPERAPAAISGPLPPIPKLSTASKTAEGQSVIQIWAIVAGFAALFTSIIFAFFRRHRHREVPQ